MTSLIIPIFLVIVGVIVALVAYRSIRRGAARYYTLEREALLRRAGYTVLASMFFFLAAAAVLVYDIQQITVEEAIESGDVVEGVSAATATISIFPPTSTVQPTADTSLPTTTPTPVLRRAVVDGTGGNGLYLREVPGGPEIEILDDNDSLSILPDEPQEFNGTTWVKVRTFTGGEGWVAEQFLTTR